MVVEEKDVGDRTRNLFEVRSAKKNSARRMSHENKTNAWKMFVTLESFQFRRARMMENEKAAVRIYLQIVNERT